MPKIFLYCYPAQGWGAHDVIGYALAEDGAGLASHLSSNKSFSQHDMGLTSDWKHESYKKHYPEGFELEWVDDPDNHPGVAAAYALNQQAVEHSLHPTSETLPDQEALSTPEHSATSQS